jgi:membrane protein
MARCPPMATTERPSRLRRAVTVGLEAWQRAQAVDAYLAAAGVAFFALLSIVPAMAALVALYGLFADPADVAQELTDLFGSDLGPGRQWILDQLQRLAETSSTSLTLAAVVALLLAVWSASSGVRHLLDAVDLAFGLPRATLVRARLRGVLGMLALIVAAALVVGLLSIAPDVNGWVSWVRYPLIVAVVLFGCGRLYRPGGARGLLPAGAVVATVIWAVGSVGLGVYVARGPDLEAAYGAFASIVVVMLWLWICGIALLAGAHVTAVLRDDPPAEPV